jgi:DNA-binding PadR family transcriptional regulator
MAFTILCQLAEAPAHPYKLQRLLRERGKVQLLGLNPDSLYHAIVQLQRAGLIEGVETTRDGNRPERRVYQITDLGRQEVMDRARQLLVDTGSEYPQAIGALAHLPGLTPATARDLLGLRATALAGEVAGLEIALHDAADAELPRVFVVEAEYALALKRAELAWVRQTVEELRAGRLSWDRTHLTGRCEGGLATPDPDGGDGVR